MGVIAERHGGISNPPLVYTMFALGFPQETSLDSKISDIQRALKSEYPIYETNQTQTIDIKNDSTGSQRINTSTENNHMFFSADRKRGIVIKANLVAYHTSAYEGFSRFSGWLEHVLKVISKELQLSVYSTVGIRYVDAIEAPEEGGDVDSLLNVALRPFPLDHEGLPCKFSSQVHAFNTEEGVLILKSYRLYEDGPCIPHELQAGAKTLQFGEFTRKGPFVVLDFDHNYTCPGNTAEKLDISSLLDKVSLMHDGTSKAFLGAVTKVAVEGWR